MKRIYCTAKSTVILCDVNDPGLLASIFGWILQWSLVVWHGRYLYISTADIIITTSECGRRLSVPKSRTPPTNLPRRTKLPWPTHLLRNHMPGSDYIHNIHNKIEFQPHSRIVGLGVAPTLPCSSHITPTGPGMIDNLKPIGVVPKSRTPE